MSRTFWRRGDIIKFAKLSGVSASYMGDILHRRRGVSPHKAKFYEDVSRRVLKEVIPFEDWVFNRETFHPAFFGKPIKNK